MLHKNSAALGKCVQVAAFGNVKWLPKSSSVPLELCNSSKARSLTSSALFVTKDGWAPIAGHPLRYFSTSKFLSNKYFSANEQTQKQPRFFGSNFIMPSNAKEFNFNDYDVIGFDLDCTLLRYKLNEMVPLEYNLLREFLVEQRNYPRALLSKEFDADFLQKGLILDVEKGNILKLSKDAKILRAAHGTRKLSKNEIRSTYGAECKWTVSTQFFESPLSTWNGPLSEKLRTLLDYFDISASLVFAHAVDALDADALSLRRPVPRIYKIWPDLLDGLVQIYSRENFANGQSGYFEALKAHPKRYMIPTSAKVLQWLRDLRSAGKALFLLTGSNADFANFTASNVMGSNWQELFDCTVCFAKKPGFFTMQRNFLKVRNEQEIAGSEIELNTALPLNSIYTQGNWTQLLNTLAKKVGKPPADVRALYVGDNLIQDVYAPVKHGDLESVAVCEEMLAEEALTNYYEHRDIVTSNFWGSYFSVDGEMTLFSNIIKEYTQLCIPLVDSVAESKVTDKFHCENETSYFPKAPKALLPCNR